MNSITGALLTLFLWHHTTGFREEYHESVPFYPFGDFFKALQEYQEAGYMAPLANAEKLPGEEKELGAYRVQLGRCSGDGLRVWGDHQVRVVKRGKDFEEMRELLCGGGGAAAEAEIELNDNEELGIRITTTSCEPGSLPAPGSLPREEGMLVRHSLRIEDPDGYMMERFVLRILQSVDIGAAMSDAAHRRAEEDKEETLMTPPSKNYSTRWGCDPVTPTVFLSPEFPDFVETRILGSTLPPHDISCAVNGTCRYPPSVCGESSSCCPSSNLSVSCGCYSNTTGTCHQVSGWNAQWEAHTPDGMRVHTQISHDFPPLTGTLAECEEDDENDAEVLLKLVTAKDGGGEEWNLVIRYSHCLFLEGPSRYLRFTGDLTLSEDSFYQRMGKVATEYVLKRRGKFGSKQVNL